MGSSHASSFWLVYRSGRAAIWIHNDNQPTSSGIHPTDVLVLDSQEIVQACYALVVFHARTPWYLHEPRVVWPHGLEPDLGGVVRKVPEPIALQGPPTIFEAFRSAGVVIVGRATTLA